MLNTTQAAEILCITRQAVFAAIKLKKLKGTKEHSRWSISEEDLDEYKRNKYNRDYSVYNDAPLYDQSKGEFSVKKASEECRLKKNQVYYFIRKGCLRSHKKRAAWIIDADGINDLKRMIEERKLIKDSR